MLPLVGREAYVEAQRIEAEYQSILKRIGGKVGEDLSLSELVLWLRVMSVNDNPVPAEKRVVAVIFRKGSTSLYCGWYFRPVMDGDEQVASCWQELTVESVPGGIPRLVGQLRLTRKLEEGLSAMMIDLYTSGDLVWRLSPAMDYVEGWRVDNLQLATKAEKLRVLRNLAVGRIPEKDSQK